MEELSRCRNDPNVDGRRLRNTIIAKWNEGKKSCHLKRPSLIPANVQHVFWEKFSKGCLHRIFYSRMTSERLYLSDSSGHDTILKHLTREIQVSHNICNDNARSPIDRSMTSSCINWHHWQRSHTINIVSPLKAVTKSEYCLVTDKRQWGHYVVREVKTWRKNKINRFCAF